MRMAGIGGGEGERWKWVTQKEFLEIPRKLGDQEKKGGRGGGAVLVYVASQRTPVMADALYTINSICLVLVSTPPPIQGILLALTYPFSQLCRPASHVYKVSRA